MKPRALAFALVASFAFAGDAGANMAKWWSDGESHGALIPQTDTKVRVDSEDLSFVVAPSLERAEVSATYFMTNGGAEDVRADVAFVMVASEIAQRSQGANEPDVANATVTIGGETIAGHLVTEAEVLEPALERWLASRPAAGTELARLAAWPERPTYWAAAALRAEAPGCRSECIELVRWYRDRNAPAEDAKASRRRETVVRAAEQAIPDQVEALQTGWSTRSFGRPLSWLTFPLAIPAGQSRKVEVRYTHHAGSDASHAVNTVFTYRYLLSPARRWASFGALHIDIQVPEGSLLRAPSLPFTAENGTRYRASTNGLPAGELSFEVMSKRGLVLGMTQSEGYWIMLLGVMSAVTVVAASLLGRRFARVATRGRRVLLCVFVSGLGALVWNSLVAKMLSEVFPQRAFGHSYNAGFGLIGAILLSAIPSIAISSLFSRREKAATPEGARPSDGVSR